MLLVTKLHPPFVSARTVARERLFERLRDGQGRRLTLVACPAGFGKSTLLAAWRETELQRRPVAWVTLDEGDNDPAVLWAHVSAALGFDPPATSAPLREVVLPRLINALAERDEVALVLDDFHRLSSASTRETVAWFVTRLPANVQLVLSTRTDPALPLATLRVRGELLELRADELRFTTEEADEFLNQRLGLQLQPDDVELLVTRTEGWPAGIYLAALSLAGTDDKHGLVTAFDGTSAHVVDFLAGEVLAAHPPELQRFMLHTSVLERLCAPLCDAVTGSPGSAQALDSLARTNLFLLPLDDRHRWFRFHHLFAQILRVELAKREPHLGPDLHRRAHEWHREFGTTDEAIHHAVEGKAFGEAARLIAGTWVHYANAGRIESVNDWLAHVPDEGDQRLLLAKAWVSALRGREPDMRAAATKARALGNLADGPLPDGFISVESSLSVLEATFGWGDVSAILAHGARSEQLEPPDSPWRPVITWALGWAHYCNGDLDEAERWLGETTRIAPPVEQWIVGVAAIADLSLIAGMRGRRAEQLRLALEAVEVARTVGLLDAVEDGEVHTAYGVALAAHGRAGEALPSLEKGVFLRRLWAQKLDLVDGLMALASTVAELGDRERATALFDEAQEIAAQCADAGVLPVRLAAARKAARLDRATPNHDELSERELTVLRHLRGGLSEREIAAELYLSFNTVHSHVKSIYRKLGVSSRAAAVERARDFT
ncbi:helix-turn-helix transcriptional regulator [Solirubrobacter ginsenosidimutans]|uniref:helix-turn-helix transcriptional regulator n=1 Tax=Solirubrobacter ginsenosidimutans TaxID=490573 RepID=UPI0027E3A913|nr:LuxR C-terminal-related transcriptional regulator [Solirubrobacter ginsenosidimutans]